MLISEIQVEGFGEYEDIYVTFCEEFRFERVNSLDIGGCTAPAWLNYNPYATFDDVTCNNNSCYDYNSTNRKNISIKEPSFLNK